MTMCRVFTTAGLVYIAGGLAYLVAGTSELQVSGDGVRSNNQENMFTKLKILRIGPRSERRSRILQKVESCCLPKLLLCDFYQIQCISCLVCECDVF